MRRWPAPGSRRTEESSRSSSGTPSWVSSESRPRTRTTPSERYGQGFASSRVPRTSSRVGGEPLRLRVGINTGEALVRLGASAGLGERLLSGDAINTASRIQSVAPEMGVAVGLATYEATTPVFDYEELEPARLKGKAEPVRVFQATAARARFGTDLTRTHDMPFVGREIDLALLEGHLRQDGRLELRPARHRRRRAGPRKEPPRRRAFRLHRLPPRAHHLAAGTLPPLWGGDHLLGARGDPQGAHRASSE